VSISDPRSRALIEAVIHRYNSTRDSGVSAIDHVAKGILVQQAFAALQAPLAPMTEDEIQRRALLAAEASFGRPLGRMTSEVQAAAQALRDLDKPLVDPVVLACREIVAASKEARGIDSIKYANGERDDSQSMCVAVAAYRAGQDAARGN